MARGDAETRRSKIHHRDTESTEKKGLRANARKFFFSVSLW